RTSRVGTARSFQRATVRVGRRNIVERIVRRVAAALRTGDRRRTGIDGSAAHLFVEHAEPTETRREWKARAGLRSEAHRRRRRQRLARRIGCHVGARAFAGAVLLASSRQDRRDDQQHCGDETTRALQMFVKEQLLPYKYPRRVVYMDTLPKTGTGKIDRQALKSLPSSTL